MVENEGFEVNDAVEIESLDDVQEQQFTIPPASNVLLKIARVGASETKDGGFKQLEVSLQVAEGIEVDGELKFKNAFATTFPMRVFYWVSPEKREAGLNAAKTTTQNWYKNKQYLVEFKKLLEAAQLNVNDFMDGGKLKVDELCAALKGVEVRGNILKVEEDTLDKETRERVKTGRFLNEVKYLKPAL